MRAINRQTGYEIEGTVDLIPGTAKIQSGGWTRKAEGGFDFEWDGETDVWWDGQETTERDGEKVYVDAGGDECLESDIVLVGSAYFEYLDKAARIGSEAARAIETGRRATLIAELVREAAGYAHAAERMLANAIEKAGTK